MISADVYFPALNKSFEFMLASDQEIRIIIGEMLEIICQSERLSANAAAEDLLLCDVDGGRILSSTATLAQYGIQSAARLMLV